MQKVRVLVADDDVAQGRALGTSLVSLGYACELVCTGAGAFSAVVRRACDIVICDVRLGASRDLEILDRMRTSDRTVPVIVLATLGTVAGAVEAMKRGAFQYLVRPCSGGELHTHICAALEAGELARPRVVSPSLPPSSDELVHQSATMNTLMQTISLVARSSAPVLIVGESGSGKELVARAIHERGPRRAGAFVAINTTAIPEQLLESELFGHVRGAYTGATHARAGLFAEADGGTLLLDEIGDMPKSLQPKLLRVLQRGEVRAVGSDRARYVDVRMIAATHRDLSALVREGQFRDDLRYRLNTLTLRVPPLRERRADIVPLATQLLSAAIARNPESPVRSLSPQAMSTLEDGAWPGNVRELESAIERLVVLGQHPVVEWSDLTSLEPASVASGKAWLDAGGQSGTMRQMTERYLAWTLEQTHGDKASAAARLGIDISTLYRRQRGKRSE